MLAPQAPSCTAPQALDATLLSAHRRSLPCPPPEEAWEPWDPAAGRRPWAEGRVWWRRQRDPSPPRPPPPIEAASSPVLGNGPWRIYGSSPFPFPGDSRSPNVMAKALDVLGAARSAISQIDGATNKRIRGEGNPKLGGGEEGRRKGHTVHTGERGGCICNSAKPWGGLIAIRNKEY